MSAPPFMKFYVADYLSDTTHLNALEHGAYLLLLMGMWRAGGTLPANDEKLRRVARCNTDEWAAIKDEVMAFFQHVGGCITHKRLAQEMSRYTGIVEKRKSASKKGVSEKAKKNNQVTETDGNHLVTKPEPEPEKEQKEETPLPLFDVDDAFRVFWADYPNKVGKRDAEKKFEKALNRIGGADPVGVLMLGLTKAKLSRQWMRGFIPNPATWLHQGRWEDEPAEIADATHLNFTEQRDAHLKEQREKAFAQLREEMAR